MTKAADIVRLLHAHPLPARPRPPPVRNHWQAFLALWRHGGEPPPREERGLRWTAAAASLCMHLGFALLLLWFALVRLPPPPAEGEGSRVRIEFVGRAAPEQADDALPEPVPDPEEAVPMPAAAAAAAPRSPAAAVQPPEVPLPAPEVAAAPPTVVERELPEPAPAPAQQPLQVTETPQPTIDFVLPPTPPRVTEAMPRNIEAPVLEVPSRDIVVPVRPAPQAVPEPTLAAPDLARAAPLRTREVPAPPQPPVVDTPRLPVEAPPVRQVDARVPQVAEREIPAPAPPPAPEAAPTPAPSAPSQEAAPAARAPSAAAQTAPAAPAAPGARAAAPAPVRDDDWGISDRNQPGAARNPGLFNRDGSARLPPGAVAGEPAPPRGAPGGAEDGWSRERFEQAGTWLKRPPYDYTPTRFEQYWVPSESLLAEWVRRNVRELEIPIPGTSLRLSCVVSVLQFGGGCGLVDPNRQENPAGARPPPDIPFKPELQEGNGALPPNLEPEGEGATPP